ncbi:hypothetical protein [Telmatospirillum sp.]|uniref:hypothetical protein n=1 Tax=Telmatospirillum sp. TaxID=2079197 RepID=UPI00284A5A04|nr:hypothetical protein [Telmatospirillum sp.]MDR3435039.1 hypothetical protein [Telmatospirillum sp.]
MTSPNQPARLCRRAFLRNLAFTAAGLGVTVSGHSVAAADRRATQKAVDYRDKAQGLSTCDSCKYFQPPSACSIVEGTIAAAGWCSKYAKKS